MAFFLFGIFFNVRSNLVRPKFSLPEILKPFDKMSNISRGDKGVGVVSFMINEHLVRSFDDKPLLRSLAIQSTATYM